MEAEDVPNKRIFDSPWGSLGNPIVVSEIGRKCIECRIEISSAKYILVSLLRLRSVFAVPPYSSAYRCKVILVCFCHSFALNYDQQSVSKMNVTKIRKNRLSFDNPIVYHWKINMLDITFRKYTHPPI